jgi:hypothetical protein
MNIVWSSYEFNILYLEISYNFIIISAWNNAVKLLVNIFDDENLLVRKMSKKI